MKQCLGCQKNFEQANWTCPHCGYHPQKHESYIALYEGDKRDTGYDGSYFAPLAALEHGHFWFEARNRAILSVMQKHLDGIQSFLEIGCGTGFVLSAIAEKFPELQLFGADYFAEGLGFAASRIPQAKFYQLDARAMPLYEEFDAIGAFDVIEHIKEDTVVLTEMFRALKKGGYLLLTVPQHRFLWSVADEYKQHVRRYERTELIQKLQDAGFQLHYANSFMTLILPMMLVSRFVQNRAKERPDRLTELKINPWLNRSLSAILKLETQLLGRGMAFGLGGSLLVIARKGQS